MQEYEDGKLTAEAKAIYEAILEHGPLDTVRLRREARMSAESAKPRFDRALVELQVGLKVIPIGVAQAGAWSYAFIYEILQRHFPDLPEQARPIGRGAARRVLVQRYIDNVVAADRKMVAKVFHVLKWTPKDLERTITTLFQDGTVQERDRGTETSPTAFDPRSEGCLVDSATRPDVLCRSRFIGKRSFAPFSITPGFWIKRYRLALAWVGPRPEG